MTRQRVSDTFAAHLKTTRKDIIPIQVDGAPEQDNMLQPHPGQARSDNPERPSGMIQVTVRTTGGFKIHQSGLDYEGLKRFIAKLATLQSDGYNAYNYIDGQLVKIEHICCLAHARAKFKYAQEQGQDERATYFLERIARLYLLEGEYKRLGLSFDEIKSRRNSAETTDILTEMSCRLKELRDDGVPKGDLMEKALNYLDHFWKQIFNYRNDGRYSIAGSIAERCIRPLTRERSSSIHFASHRGAEVSAIFHTVFSTCRMVGVSALDYLKKFFEAMLAGRTDYENLLPSTIGQRS